MEKIEYKLIATTVGLNKLNNAALLGKPIKLTGWVVGDGGGESYQVDASQTKLKNQVDSGKINSVTPNTETTSSVEFIIDHARGPYFVREAGFLDSEGDLIYIASVPTQEKVNSESSVTDMTFEFMINFFNSDAITFTIDPNKAIASHTHVSNEVKRATGYCGTWQESPRLVNEGDFVYCTKSMKRFRPLSLPYQVNSAEHPDPNELVPSELKEIGYYVDTCDVVKMIDESLNTRQNAKDISNLGTQSNNRDLIYSLNSNVFVNAKSQVRANVLPTDDLTIFKGEGEVLSLDPFGNEHVINLSFLNEGSLFTPSQMINQSLKTGGALTVGFLGDSITDGSDSTGWVSNPWDGKNLTSTNYDHDVAGAPNGWVSRFKSEINRFVMTGNAAIKTANISKSGQKLFDGWAYRNFDYGFFQNSAYGNKAPDVLYIAMGVNDNSSLTNLNAFESYLNEWEKCIRKAWGYGCAVGVVTVSNMTLALNTLENGLKKRLGEGFRNLEFIDVTAEMYETMQNLLSPNQADFFGVGGTLDLTHPKDDGHSMMGATMVRRLLPGMVMDKEINSAIRSSNCLVKTVTNKVIAPTLIAAPSYLSRFGAFAGVNTSESFNCFYSIYCQNAESTVTFIFPEIAPNSEVSIGIRQFTRSGNYDYISKSLKVVGGVENIVTLTGVKAGFNQVNIAVNNSEDSFILPIVMISKNKKYDTLTTQPLVLPSGSIEAPTFGSDPLISNPEQAISTTRKPPTDNNIGNFSVSYGARIYSNGNKSVALAYNPDTGDGVLLEIISGAASLYDLSSGNKGDFIDALPGNFSGNVEVQVATSGTGITVRLYNSDGSVSDASATPLNGRLNGLIYHANFTDSEITQWLRLSATIS